MGTMDRPVSLGRWLIVAAAVVVVGVFAMVVWYAYLERGIGSGVPRLVRAAPGPYRSAPDDPGGQAVANAGSSVVDLLGADRSPQPKVEQLLPSAPAKTPPESVDRGPASPTASGAADQTGRAPDVAGATPASASARHARPATCCRCRRAGSCQCAGGGDRTTARGDSGRRGHGRLGARRGTGRAAAHRRGAIADAAPRPCRARAGTGSTAAGRGRILRACAKERCAAARPPPARRNRGRSGGAGGGSTAGGADAAAVRAAAADAPGRTPGPRIA